MSERFGHIETLVSEAVFFVMCVTPVEGGRALE